MISKVSTGSIDLASLESDLKAFRESSSLSTPKEDKAGGTSFSDLLKNGINEVNSNIKASEKASMDLATGKSSNIHEVMLASTRAELGFNMLVQLRNKALESYQEVMRMQV